MEQKINDKKINKILVSIIVILLLLIILLSTGVINFKSNKYDDYEPNNEVINNEDNSGSNENGNVENQEDNDDKIEDDDDFVDDDFVDDEIIVIDDLSKYGEADYTIIKEDKNTDYSFKINSDGNIIINGKNKISNISNAKSIKLFSPPSPKSILYILTEDGDIYKYDTNNYESNNYTAIKMEKYSNIKQIITYKKRSSEANGGCDYIVVVDNNEKYYELNSFCV